jgi:hypothetical protein
MRRMLLIKKKKSSLTWDFCGLMRMTG